MSTLIGTAFVVDAPGEESLFPQVAGKSSAPDFQAVYWRAMSVMFASSVRNNPTARHVLFCNTSPPNNERLPILDLFTQWGVELVTVPFTYRGAAPRTQQFGNVLYLFDVVKYLAEHLDDGTILILDPDCVWIRPAEVLASLVEARGAVFYDSGYPPIQDNNGLTRRQLAAIAGTCSEDAPLDHTALPVFVGGELYAVTATENRRIAQWIDSCLQWNDALRREGKPSLITEEHFLSLLAHCAEYDTSAAAAHIKRIWTTFHHRTSSPSDLGLSIWHLPSEKRTGFAALFGEITRKRTLLWEIPQGDAFARCLGGYFGVPQPSRLKLVTDAIDRVKARAQRL
jgi:hypothetical protein